MLISWLLCAVGTCKNYPVQITFQARTFWVNILLRQTLRDPLQRCLQRSGVLKDKINIGIKIAQPCWASYHWIIKGIGYLPLNTIKFLTNFLFSTQSNDWQSRCILSWIWSKIISSSCSISPLYNHGVLYNSYSALEKLSKYPSFL